MPITKTRRPQALMIGDVIDVTPMAAYNDAGQKTGDVGRYDVTLVQANVATPDVRFPVGFDSPRVPEKGDRVALVVEIGESDQYGANLRIVRHATDADLDAYAQYLPALAGK